MIFYFCQITVRYCTLSPKKWWGRIEHKIQITGRKIVCTYVGICCQDARTVLYCTSSSKWTVQYRYRYLSSDQIGRSYFLFSNKNIIIVNCLFTKKKRKEKRLFINMTMLQEWYAVRYGTVLYRFQYRRQSIKLHEEKLSLKMTFRYFKMANQWSMDLLFVVNNR